MDAVRTSVTVDDNASSTIDAIKASWQQFRQLQGWQSDEVLGVQVASVVFREWEVYLYRLARGLVGSSGF